MDARMSMTQLESRNAAIAGAPRLQTAARGQGVTHRVGAAPARQTELHHVTVQRLDPDVRDESQRLESALHVRVVFQIVDARDFDDHGRSGAAHGELARVGVGGAVDALGGGSREFAASILEHEYPPDARGGTGLADQGPLASGSTAD